MTQHGFARSAYDRRIYLKKLSDGSYVYLLLYVYDMLIAAKEMSRINLLKKHLNDEFEMKVWGQFRGYWGWILSEIEGLKKLRCLRRLTLKKFSNGST